MSENATQKNRWNRLRRNRPNVAYELRSLSDSPLEAAEWFYTLGVKARTSGRRFKAAMKMGMEGGVP